jgi:hypothetical protein
MIFGAGRIDAEAQKLAPLLRFERGRQRRPERAVDV